MKLNRESLLAILKIASAGAAMPPRMVVLEQSDCFVFTGKELIAFNDEILVRTPSPLDFDVVVAAADLLKVLGKLPDTEVEVSLKGGELRVEGKRRSAGIAGQAVIKLPFTEVPKPAKWSKLEDGTTGMLKQAGRTCGKDLSNPLTTVVHATPDVIEACDNFRLFRATMPTGFPSKILIPSHALTALESVALTKVSLSTGWAHFKTSGDAVLSVRCVADDYMNLTPILKVEGTETVELPGNLADMIDRAEVMGEGADPLVEITIAEAKLTILCRKDSGWYKEEKKIKYAGKALKFQVNPKFLVEVLQRTAQVKINAEKMKLSAEGVEFVVCLEAAE